tara:strand:- start:978 stop:1181 length:204 start_codon:yes stop_codon:yes gene_type:complete
LIIFLSSKKSLVMFNFFRKKTEKEKLIKLYNQKKKKAFELSRINRIESDKLEKEAFDILNKIDSLPD